MKQQLEMVKMQLEMYIAFIYEGAVRSSKNAVRNVQRLHATIKMNMQNFNQYDCAL